LGYSFTQKGYKCYHSPTSKFYVSKDVTFVETQSFFGSPSIDYQGKGVPSIDSSVGLPILDLPLEQNHKIHYSSNSPLDEHNQQESLEEETLSMLPSPVIRFKGSPYVFKRTQRIPKPPLAPTSSPSSGIEDTYLSVSSSSNHVCNDLDLRIALKQGIKSCTQHPLGNYLSYHRLSPKHRGFLTSLDAISIPKTIDKAFKD